MKQQSFAITYSKIHVKATNNNCRGDEVYWKIIRKQICSLSISRVCMFPIYQRKERTKKTQEKIKETSTPLNNNNCHFRCPLSVVHILDNKPVVGAKQLLSM